MFSKARPGLAEGTIRARSGECRGHSAAPVAGWMDKIASSPAQMGMGGGELPRPI